MILVWFNPTTQSFYTRYYKSFILNDYYVGFKNSYEHEIIKMYILNNGVHNVKDYYQYTTINSKKKNNLLLTIFKSLININQT